MAAGLARQIARCEIPTTGTVDYQDDYGNQQDPAWCETSLLQDLKGAETALWDSIAGSEEGKNFGRCQPQMREERRLTEYVASQPSLPKSTHRFGTTLPRNSTSVISVRSRLRVRRVMPYNSGATRFWLHWIPGQGRQLLKVSDQVAGLCEMWLETCPGVYILSMHLERHFIITTRSHFRSAE
jgi:hypothetical protein